MDELGGDGLAKQLPSGRFSVSVIQNRRRRQQAPQGRVEAGQEGLGSDRSADGAD